MLGPRLRAPKGDREILAHPALAEMPGLVTANHRRLARVETPILGESFSAVRSAARQALCPGADLIVQTGHQPTPFHPGVWIKNFLAFKLAQRVGGQALNLIVDNDAAKHLEIVVPHMAADGSARVTRVPLTDRAPAPDIAYEECPVPAPRTVHRICGRVTSACRNDDMREGFSLFWQFICDAHRSDLSIGELIAAARHRMERAGGIENREVLSSTVSAGRPFRLLLLHILGDLRRFIDVHNTALAEYRRAHRIRNKANPVPDLMADGDVLELPFWVWRAGAPRARLTAHMEGDGITLKRGEETVIEASADALLHAADGPALLDEADGGGWKMRPRALATTIFHRLFVADVFIHGIGGARYDLITDEIIRRYFGFEPPPYIVCSATVRLPVPTHGATQADLRREKRLLRDLFYNPDRHLTERQRGAEPFVSLVDRKWSLIRAPRGETRTARRQTFLSIRETNAALIEGVAEQVESARRRIPELERQIAADAVLGSREYAFCLFPLGALPAFYDQALRELMQ